MSTAPPLRRCWRAILRHCGFDPIVHIPDRIFEGYGPNIEAIRSFAERGAKLLITVDCGATSIEPLAEARQLGHRCRGDRSSPGRREAARCGRRGRSKPADDLSGLGHLAAVGLVFLDSGRRHPRVARARLLDRARRSPICCRCSILSRLAPLPMSCRCTASTAPLSPKV